MARSVRSCRWKDNRNFPRVDESTIEEKTSMNVSQYITFLESFASVTEIEVSRRAQCHTASVQSTLVLTRKVLYIVSSPHFLLLRSKYCGWRSAPLERPGLFYAISSGNGLMSPPLSSLSSVKRRQNHRPQARRKPREVSRPTGIRPGEYTSGSRGESIFSHERVRLILDIAIPRNIKFLHRKQSVRTGPLPEARCSRMLMGTRTHFLPPPVVTLFVLCYIRHRILHWLAMQA